MDWLPSNPIAVICISFLLCCCLGSINASVCSKSESTVTIQDPSKPQPVKPTTTGCKVTNFITGILSCVVCIGMIVLLSNMKMEQKPKS